MNWPTGAEKLLIVSVGTGSAPKDRPNLKQEDLWLLDHARHIPAALMNAASAGWDMACRMLGECRFGSLIDREYGSMVMNEDEGTNWTGAKCFAYVRYDPLVTRQGLKELGLGNIDPAKVQMMDSVDHIEDIQQVGRAYAQQSVSLAHLRGFV